MLTKLKQFVKRNFEPSPPSRSIQEDIVLIIGVILISLLSFAAGYIIAKKQEKEPIRFKEIQFYEKEKNSNYWSRNNRPLFS